MGYSIGIGLTNECNLNCAHCYRDASRVDRLSLKQVKQICEAIPVESVGMGTGENALHPEFVPIVEYLAGRGIKLSIASNGYSLTAIEDGLLSAFHDVEVSIDHPSETQQDAFRESGNWSLVHQAIDRCHRLGIEISILTTLMRTNYGQMGQMVALARSQGTNLRVNAYQAVKTDAFRLAYHEFWAGYRSLFAAGQVVSCSEPVVRAAMGLDGARSPCGWQSIRVNPRGLIIPCVYWPLQDGGGVGIEELAVLGSGVTSTPVFKLAQAEPPSAADCPCQGGCASRRALGGRLDAHDEYCPWVRNDAIDLPWQPAPAKDLMRTGNVCTTIVT